MACLGDLDKREAVHRGDRASLQASMGPSSKGIKAVSCAAGQGCSNPPTAAAALLRCGAIYLMCVGDGDSPALWSKPVVQAALRNPPHNRTSSPSTTHVSSTAAAQRWLPSQGSTSTHWRLPTCSCCRECNRQLRCGLWQAVEGLQTRGEQAFRHACPARTLPNSHN